jgi:putative copper resistance protein D
MHLLYLTCVWLHIMAAVIWVGGTIFFALVLVPAIRQPEFSAVAAGMVRWTALRFRWVGWLCFLVFIFTGSINLAFRGLTWNDLSSAIFWRGSFGSVLTLKLLTFAAILAISAIHDFVIGPRAAAAWEKDARSAASARLRRQAVRIARLNLLLALIAIILGTMLVRGAPW